MDIYIENLSKKYVDKQVLKDITLWIKDKRITAIMAPSGRGKTTLLRIMAGMEQADSGSIRGMDGKKISMVFQEDRLCQGLSAAVNVGMVCSKETTREEILRELEVVGLKGSERQPVSSLSGGMRRRTALVRALMASWDILILDEPFQGLDEKNKRNMMDYVRKKSEGKTVILVTHDEAEARYMGSELIFLE
ncbi:MAG: ABC transporter ATP-binding protein [Lachnospiraceae bacterium]|nr:ABC transporter ATP-binding protein [Lachnospiraceae bacterium]